MERSHYWKFSVENSAEYRVLSLFPFHREMMSCTGSRALPSDDYYSNYDETPLSPLPPGYEDDPTPDSYTSALPFQTIIPTSLNLEISSNKKKPYPSNHKQRTAFTVDEMNNAENAEDFNLWENFSERVRYFALHSIYHI